jgi:hypothetical protein
VETLSDLVVRLVYLLLLKYLILFLFKHLFFYFYHSLRCGDLLSILTRWVILYGFSEILLGRSRRDCRLRNILLLIVHSNSNLVINH